MQVVTLCTHLFGVVTGLRAEGFGFPSSTRQFVLLKHLGRFYGPPSFLFNCYYGFFPRDEASRGRRWKSPSSAKLTN